MDGSFWQRKWERNDIAFHEREANPLLDIYFRSLALPAGSRVFLPLCGKTLDIRWLLAHGLHVAGVELSRIAVEQLFADLGVTPAITSVGPLDRYCAPGIDIFAGDILNLSRATLGAIDAVYDRAALVALPASVRDCYAAHLIAVTDRAPQLLITYDYDQRQQNGPPFSVDADEVGRHYGQSHAPRLLARADIKGGLKGKCPAEENVWLLTGRTP